MFLNIKQLKICISRDMPSLLNFVILVFFIFQKRNPYNKKEYKEKKGEFTHYGKSK